MSANKIKKPILLIHGEQDNNSGTLTMQVKSCALFRETYYTPFIYIIQFLLHDVVLFLPINGCSVAFIV
jgi:hypothetical protein